eukprot:tig00000057_g71.t1
MTPLISCAPGTPQREATWYMLIATSSLLACVLGLAVLMRTGVARRYAGGGARARSVLEEGGGGTGTGSEEQEALLAGYRDSVSEEADREAAEEAGAAGRVAFVPLLLLRHRGAATASFAFGAAVAVALGLSNGYVAVRWLA